MLTRTLVVWCPDWPLVAAGVPPEEPAAVFHANRVVACTAGARAEGVARGLRRREAQGRCPELRVESYDPGADLRAFQPIIAAVETFSPRLEMTRPGACALPTRGPSRYFGGDDVLARRIADAVDEILTRLPAGGPRCQVGIAEGPFAASIAARRAPERTLVVPPGETPMFLAPLPVGVLDEPDLTGLLTRLGLRTLGAFAAVPSDDVIGRFGPVGVIAHRRARGVDDRPLDCHEPPPDLSVDATLDPPADRVDTAAFAAKSITDRLCAELAGRGLVCTCIRVEAETEHGEHLSRIWRHHRAFTPATVSERVRWQLEGWLTTGGLTLVRIAPEEVLRSDGYQDGFWGGSSAADERAARGLARIQGLLGPDAVLTAVLGGGRGFADQVRLVPWGEPRSPETALPRPAWPGRIPSPSPAIVRCPPTPADVVDASGIPVSVTSRSVPTSTPSRLSIDSGAWEEVDTWAGPWTVDERWWDVEAHRRYARFQVVLRDGAAHLVILEGGRWWVEASYD